VLQAVRARVQTYFDHEPAHDDESGIVFIGYHPNRGNVQRLMAEFTGHTWE